MKRVIGFLGFFFAVFFYGNNSHGFTIDLYYGGKFSVLDASATILDSAEIKDDKVTTAGSTFAFNMQRDTGLLRSFTLDLSSTSTMFPYSFERDDEKSGSLKSASILLRVMGLPAAYFTTEVFTGTGIVKQYSDGTEVPHYTPAGKRLWDGDEFNLEKRFSKLYLMWNTENMERLDLDKDYSGLGYYYGLGLVHADVTGVEYVNMSRQWYGWGYERAIAEQKESGFGFGIMMGLRYGSWRLSDSTFSYFQFNAETLLAEYAMGLKSGYEVGLISSIGKNVIVRPHLGGYVWLNAGSGAEYKSLSTDFGYTLGLELNYRFSK